MKRFVEYYLEEKDMSHCDCKNPKGFSCKASCKAKERLQGQVENTKVKKSNQKSMVVLHDNTWKQYTRNTDHRMRS